MTMLTAGELGGLMAMMPAFATDDAADLRARATVDVARLHAGVDRMVRDGANAIATTGSFGECHALLIDEFATLVRESVAAIAGRIPLVVGVPSDNARETVEKIEIAERAGADAVLVGIPYYIPSSVANAVRYIREIAELFPKIGVLIYHNPAIHHVALPVDAFLELARIPNVIGMKDSHRDPFGFVQLQNIVRGKMSIFVGQWQYFALAELGAAGFWSIDAWMGPWPALALRDAVRRGDRAAAAAITTDLVPSRAGAGNLMWRETASKIGVRIAGYVDPGPLRSPFVEIPPEVEEAQRRHAAHWLALCEK
jgi:dihydrodipicolinate synthase/N-acetylneuraminate lyase